MKKTTEAELKEKEQFFKKIFPLIETMTDYQKGALMGYTQGYVEATTNK